ncbi:MAG: hypothetical protein ABIJ31_14075 [Pseudomonadota bacterium]
MAKLVFSICLVVIGIGVGYGVQIIISTYRPTTAIDVIRKNLQRAALLGFNPVAILGATWVANIDDIKIAALPFMGMIALVTGGCLAFAVSRLLHLNSGQTGSYIVCGGFTNIGSLGALFCFIFLGEAGFALVPFYKLFEEFMYYAIGFPIAKSYSSDMTRSLSYIARIKATATDLFVVVAVSSIAAGLVLNLSRIARPPVYGTINSVFIPLAAFLLLVSIGMAMRFSSVKTFFVPGLMIALIKFAVVPLLVVGIGYGLGLDRIDNGLPLKVTLILSSMPVGFIAMVPPTLYRLDIDLANACWLMTNAAMLLEIPLLVLLMKWI